MKSLRYSGRFNRFAGTRSCARRWRSAARPGGRNLRAGIVRQNHAYLEVIAEMQKEGGTCAFIDAEHALDVQYASKLGVAVPDLLISQPDTGEQALEIADALV